jgi:hypothetical protein
MRTTCSLQCYTTLVPTHSLYTYTCNYNTYTIINRAFTKKEASLREKFQECTHTPVVVGRTTATNASTPHSATQNPLTGSLARRSSAASIVTPTSAAAAAGSDATVTPGDVLFAVCYTACCSNCCLLYCML